MAESPADPLNAVMIDRRDLTPSLTIVRVQPDRGEVPRFVPGQFVTLGLPARPEPDAPASRPGSPGRVRLTRRAYSIASDPRQRNHIELLVTLVEDGRLTPRLWPLDPGDRLWMDDKVQGDFTLDPVPSDSNVILIATGTGLAPFVSMLRHFAGTGRWRRLALIHSARTQDELAYREELTDLAARHDDIAYLPTLTREPQAPESDWQGLRGRVQSLMVPAAFRDHAGFDLDPRHTHALLCGNPAMIQAIRSLLTGLGFQPDMDNQPGQIHTERYW